MDAEQVVTECLQDTGLVLPAEKPMKVLAAEDNPVFLSVLRNMLTHWGYETVVAHDGNEAWKILQTPDAPRLAVLDWMMPGMDGVEICRRVRTASREPYVYILLVTARTNSQDLVEGMEAGADDYLTKPLAAHELRVRLRAGQRILDLQEELVRTREALRVQATHDGLTGLQNRDSILDTLQRELARAGREKQSLSVIMADLDRFKQINDTYGHVAGDGVLAETAQRMKQAIRRYDAIGRYGGEEFLLVLPRCDRDEATARAERIRDAIAGQPFPGVPANHSFTCSFGITTRLCPTLAETDELVREADQALYVAKHLGRNRVEHHNAVGCDLAAAAAAICS